MGTLAAGIATYAMIGFALRFFLDVTLASLERVRLAPGIPRLGLLALFEYGLMGLAVVVLYVLPLITLPLLPLGILALASWEDTRGLDVRWAFRAARRFPRMLGRLWAILALWCGLLAAALVGIAKGLDAWVRHLVAASGGRTGGLILASAAEVLESLVLALVVCMFLFVLFRCSGLLGSHHPEVLDMLPEKPPSPLLLAGIVGAGVCVSFHVHYWLWVLLGRR